MLAAVLFSISILTFYISNYMSITFFKELPKPDYPVCAITIKRFGTYRFKYRTYGCSWTDGARLTKNGDVIANSIITPVANAVLKVIDVYCEANDVIKLQGYKTAGIVDPIFLVSIAVPEISSAISTIITVP